MRSKSPPLAAASHHILLLATTSASVLAYEIILMRLLSISQWHHFAYMVISMALLGFGAAGSLLFLTFKRIQRHLEECLVGLAGATAISFSLSFSLSQKVGLDPLQLVWQPYQWIKMFFTYLLMGSPFLLAGGIVGIILTGAGDKTHRMYAVDLLGAGIGALAIVPALCLGPPWGLLPALGCLILSGASWCARRMRHPVRGFASLMVSAAVLTMVYLKWPPLPKIHEAKALSMTLAFPDAQIEAEKVGPLGMIHVVGSALIRHVPGLSLNFGLHAESKKAILPEQKAIFTDGEALSPISRFTGNLDELKYLDFTTMALPYHIRQPEKVLVVGAGGGSDVLLGLLHHTPNIVALEVNHQIADLLRGPFARFSGGLYLRPEVKLTIKEARQFLQVSDERFDQIHLSLIDSFGASAGGLYSATESYLYTTEAFKLYLSHLTESGFLIITRWLKLPPRDSLKIISTALAALRDMELSDEPEKHLLFIRSWKTATILVSTVPFSPEEIVLATKFCDERSFDLAYYAGMDKARANRYDVQEHPYYFNGANALCGPEAESFLEDYLFDVSPTTDDRPYFSNFFRWKKFQSLFHQLKRESITMVEFGYLFILATLFQAVMASGLLILVPLLFLGWARRRSAQVGPMPWTADTLSAFLYFGLIGMAFMFLEMALIPKYILLLSHPVYSAAVVLSSILVFAGCGSLCVRRFQRIRTWFLWIPVIIIVSWVGFHLFTGDQLFRWALKWPLGGRLSLAVITLSIISFFLGWPFPSGLRVMGKKFPSLVPWAWGINGCASVVGAVLGKYLAVTIGFRLLMSMACALYFLAIAIFHLSLRDWDLIDTFQDAY